MQFASDDESDTSDVLKSLSDYMKTVIKDKDACITRLKSSSMSMMEVATNNEAEL